MAITQSATAITLSTNPSKTTLTTVYTSRLSTSDSIETSTSVGSTTIDLNDLANLEQNGDESDQEKSVISDSIVNENNSYGEYTVVTPILETYKDLRSKDTGIERREANADADADALRWLKWFKYDHIYKREADATADAGAWKWHKWFKYDYIYKREIDADA